MFYITIPIGILLFHSLYTLNKKSDNRTSIFFKVYGLCVLLWNFIFPALAFIKMCDYFGISPSIKAFGALAISLIIFFAEIKLTTVYTDKQNRF